MSLNGIGSSLPCSLSAWAVLVVMPMAASLPIEGEWGDLSGCDYTNGSPNVDIDDMMLLRKSWISGYIFSCEIASVDTVQSGKHLITGVCHQEGDDEAYDIRSFVLNPIENGTAFEVFFEDGTRWGAVRPC